mgnify:CR=1 FL=1
MTASVSFGSHTGNGAGSQFGMLVYEYSTLRRQAAHMFWWCGSRVKMRPGRQEVWLQEALSRVWAWE